MVSVGGLFISGNGVSRVSITAKELAAQLKLSESAVSLALNNKPGVSTATRKRVFEAAKAQGYDFSRKALARAGKRGTIGLVVYKKSGAVVDDTPFFSALIDGISTGCRRERYDCMIRYLYEDDDISDQIYTLNLAQFSGVILLATEMDESSLKPFSGIGTPMVILDAYFEKLPFNYILINNIQGAFVATEHLIRRRHSQPGYLRSAYSISNFEQRADGFYKAVRAAGMSTAKSQVIRLTPSQEGAYADMKRALEAGERPVDCYFADNDLIAIGAMQALREYGCRIPEDVGIVGFDDLPTCEFLNPPLTTVNVPKLYMGQAAVDRVIRLTEGRGEQPLKIEVATRLIRRKSV